MSLWGLSDAAQKPKEYTVKASLPGSQGFLSVDDNMQKIWKTLCYL